MDTLLILAVIAGAILLAVVASRSSQRRALERRTAADLEVVRVVADEDVTRFGEELQRLDTDMLVTPLDEPMRQDYQRALDSYEQAKETLRTARQADDIKHVTQALEDGRYAVACVLARKDGRPLPVRRPPCFFNPAHGPSTTDIEWAPPAGIPRQVPVCAADADRVAQGAEPDIRTVREGYRPGAVLAGRARLLPLGVRLLRRLRGVQPAAVVPAAHAALPDLGRRRRRGRGHRLRRG